MEKIPVQQSQQHTRSRHAGSLCAIRMVRRGDDMILVYEPQDGSLPHRLILETASWRRELQQFPKDWRKLPDTELLGLLEP